MIYIVRVFAGGHLRLDWGSFWKRGAVAVFFDFEGGLYCMIDGKEVVSRISIYSFFSPRSTLSKSL